MQVQIRVAHLDPEEAIINGVIEVTNPVLDRHVRHRHRFAGWNRSGWYRWANARAGDLVHQADRKGLAAAHMDHRRTGVHGAMPAVGVTESPAITAHREDQLVLARSVHGRLPHFYDGWLDDMVRVIDRAAATCSRRRDGGKGGRENSCAGQAEETRRHENRTLSDALQSCCHDHPPWFELNTVREVYL